MKGRRGRLVVVPSDPIAAYERAGYDWLERYYNPQGLFREVFALSPLEERDRSAHGLAIRRVEGGRLREAIRALRPDAVRAYGGYWPADWVAANRVEGIPVIVSVHDSKPERVHPSLRMADLVLCTSEIVKRRVLDVGVEPDQVALLPNRVDPAVFRPLTEPAASAGLDTRFPARRHILHVGRRSTQKNPDTLIRALARLPADYCVVFVGVGETARYAALAAALGVGDRCFWIESVPNHELPLWYSWCDCLCVPSRWEGFGIVFIEAAACGAPIVTSDIAPMNEFLRDGASATLVADFEDPRALAAAIRRTAEDDGLRATLRAGAIAAARPFERARVDALEVGLYERAIDRTLGAPPDRRTRLAYRATGTAKTLRGTSRRIVRRVRRGAAALLPGRPRGEVTT